MFFGFPSKIRDFSPCTVQRIVTRLPNDLMLNHWLNKKNNLSVFRFRFRGAKKVNKPYIFCVLRGIFFSLGNEQKIGECHAIAYRFLR